MTRVNFCHKNLTVVSNGDLTALVIAFDMVIAFDSDSDQKKHRNDDGENYLGQADCTTGLCTYLINGGHI